jgi:phosphoadenosine phosphosulfate reductase
MTIIEEAIKLLQDNEPEEGYHLAFSGGKDSVVIKELARLSGVKYESHFALTSIDPPELLDFIRSHHKDVVWHRPKRTMYQLILDHKMPPLRMVRYCCAQLKEYLGMGRFIITGIRAKESGRRKKRKQIEEGKQKGKKFIHPIFYWSENSVWNFIRNNSIPYCKLYDEGFLRIGCIGCPMHTTKQAHFMFQKYPKHRNAYIKTFEKLRTNSKFKDRFIDAEEMFEQWISGLTMDEWDGQKQQIKLDFT